MQKDFLLDHGFRYTKNNKTILLQTLAMTKENHTFSEDKIKLFINSVSKYLDEVSSRSEKLIELFGELFTPVSYLDRNLPFYKYVTKDTYDRFISKGKFQLGTLQYYRAIENKSARDEKEGYSNLMIRSGNRDIMTSVISGFDFYVFCGTAVVDESEFTLTGASLLTIWPLTGESLHTVWRKCCEVVLRAAHLCLSWFQSSD